MPSPEIAGAVLWYLPLSTFGKEEVQGHSSPRDLRGMNREKTIS